MHIVVCIKEVPDPEARAESFTIDSEQLRMEASTGVKRVISPFDENAIEAALQIKDSLGARVTAVSLGPPSATEALKRALRMGADEAVLLHDAGFEESDAAGTAYLLSLAIRKLGDFDLVLCGRQAGDWDQGQVGAGMAELLDIPCATLVKRIDLRDGRVEVQRVMEDGYEVLELPLPTLLTLTNEINQPRLTSVAGILRTAKIEIPVWQAADLGADPSRFGEAGRRTTLTRLYAPLYQSECRLIQGEDAEEKVRQLLEALQQDHVF